MGVFRSVWPAVAVGLLLRLWHYAADRTVWYDEAVLLANILTKGWGELLGPLDHAVAAPPLYLFLLKLVAVTCGDVQLCFRFTSLVTGVGVLLAAVPLCRRTLSPPAATVCVWLVALSDNLIWHCVTVKPYGGDALLTELLLLGLVVTDRWPAARRFHLLARVAPLVLCLSYPMAFVLGGLLLATLPTAWRERGLSSWGLAAAAVVGTFAALYFGPIRVQKVPGLVDEHRFFYPTAVDPVERPVWAVMHTAEVFQYCYMVGGFGLFVLAPLGGWAGWRDGRRELVVALATPFVLTLAAASLRSYPYGLHRLMLFIAPCCLLLGGLGLTEAWRRSVHWGRGLAIGLLLATLPWPVSHLARPWPRPDSSGVARHIRAHRQPGDRVASDEPGYRYFFRGELLTLSEAARSDAARLWVPMDHYTPDDRRKFCTAYLAPGGWAVAGEWRFPDAGVLLFERPARLP